MQVLVVGIHAIALFARRLAQDAVLSLASMPSVTELDTWPFLSIVSWPDGWDRARVASLLAGPGGLDAATLRLRLGQSPPMVLERCDPGAAAAMIRILVAAGGDGFTFTHDDLAGLGATMNVRNLSVTEGALEVELREGITTQLRFETVQVIVRAHLGRTVVRDRPVPRIGTLAGRFRTRDAIKAEIESSVVKDVETSDKLDIHTSHGGIYQIDGDHFGFDALGVLRGHSDKANMDAMVELLGHLCQDAVTDTFFKLWRPPPGFETLRLPDMS